MATNIELVGEGLTEAQAREARRQIKRWVKARWALDSNPPALRVAIERHALQECSYRVDVELETSSSALRVTRCPAGNEPKRTVGYAVRQALNHLERALRPVLRPAKTALRPVG